ncbi:hypothetical protein QJS10_CPA08g00662 [Acorus calamus]|uniref:Uncharacterized protein n=1 Tax=Acorus calamus TaxID=4465 RepID=A0AAV9EDX9_ACOCL|nr:hypothetical protein QJS10_CPA08g00662 [Acorus calamus]
MKRWSTVSSSISQGTPGIGVEDPFGTVHTKVPIRAQAFAALLVYEGGVERIDEGWVTLVAVVAPVKLDGRAEGIGEQRRESWAVALLMQLKNPRPGRSPPHW